MSDESNDEQKTQQFHQMELDDRILKAIAILGWLTPTLIQEKSIPLLLEGKDVLLRAKTGSGKTAAFAIPVIQKILKLKKEATVMEQLITTLVLAPSKELCQQIKTAFDELTIKCQRDVRIVDLASTVNLSAVKHMLSERPDIIVSTPAKILAQLKLRTVKLDALETIVIDEADLVFSFGFEDDLKEVLNYLPSIYQAILASATLSEDVTTLKRLVLHNPVILKLEEPELAPVTQLTHYRILAEESDKAAILYSLIKLELIRGKSIIFVNTVDRCFKLKLFLEQFAIKSCILNSELPAKIRCHAVAQFNRNFYDIIIASDEQALNQPKLKQQKSSRTGQSSKIRSDKESGVARGIDFQRVSNVINFDFPLDTSSYVHRAGRTARGNNSGSVLSFADISEKPLLDAVEEHLKSGYSTDDAIIKNYQFKLEKVEAFRYRSNDAWRAITKVAIRDARVKEIKMELFNCDKLKSFFDNSPRDLQILRHDKQLGTVKKQAHLADVPDYIVPPELKRLSRTSGTHQGISNKRKRSYANNKSKSAYQLKQNNPLLCAQLDYGKKRKK